MDYKNRFTGKNFTGKWKETEQPERLPGQIPLFNVPKPSEVSSGDYDELRSDIQKLKNEILQLKKVIESKDGTDARFKREYLDTIQNLDGDNISANAITADKIAANAITAGKIAAGEVTADKINTDGLVMRGNITWDTADTPVKAQYSVNGSSGWHDTFNPSTDKYAKFSYNGGENWTAAMQIVGTDGSDGSDANVPGYIKSTYIDQTTVMSPTIKGGDIVGGNFIAANSTATPDGGDLPNIKRLIMNKDGIISKNDLNELNGISISSDGFSNIQFYYRDECRGQLGHAGGSLRLVPENNATLTLGKVGKMVYLKGNLNLDEANVTDWGDNKIPATFG